MSSQGGDDLRESANVTYWIIFDLYLCVLVREH
jgi:hypothetical protein